MQKLQKEFEKKKKQCKINFAAHNASIWTEALESCENRCVEAQLDEVKVDTLKA